MRKNNPCGKYLFINMKNNPIAIFITLKKEHSCFEQVFARRDIKKGFEKIFDWFIFYIQGFVGHLALFRQQEIEKKKLLLRKVHLFGLVSSLALTQWANTCSKSVK